MVIVHSLAISVEQLCARSPHAPSIENLRPKFCGSCGKPARDADGVLQLVGHGLYSRQVRGNSAEVGLWIVIWVRRFLCLCCGCTISCLPDWLHPWRWYAATVIIEALCRHCICRESSGAIGARFGRIPEATSWKSLFRWRRQLLVSPTLWGWLGPRLGVHKPAGDRIEAASCLNRLLAEAGHPLRTVLDFVTEVPGAVRRTLASLVHNRKTARRIEQFRAGGTIDSASGLSRRHWPTEKNSGLDPP